MERKKKPRQAVQVTERNKTNSLLRVLINTDTPDQIKQ